MELYDEAQAQQDRIAAGRAILGRPTLDPDFWALQRVKQGYAAAVYRTLPVVFNGVTQPGKVAQLQRRRARNRVAARSRRVNRMRAA